MNFEDIQLPFINIEKIFPKSTKENQYIGIASNNIHLLEDIYK